MGDLTRRGASWLLYGLAAALIGFLVGGDVGGMLLLIGGAIGFGGLVATMAGLSVRPGSRSGESR